jgi:lysophospholipase L1-like esterase
MSIVMAKKKSEPRSRSAYQTHVVVLFGANDAKNIIDLTERKLVRIASSHKDENVRKLAARMLSDYTSGKIAVAWEQGILPVYIFLRP